MDGFDKNKIAEHVLDVSKSSMKSIVKGKKLPWPERYSETFWDTVYEKGYDDLLLNVECTSLVSSEKQEYFIKEAGEIIQGFMSDIAAWNDTALQCNREIGTPLQVIFEKVKDDPILLEEVKKIYLQVRKMKENILESTKIADVHLKRICDLKKELRLDELTMTLNRRAFFKDLGLEMKKATRYDYPVSILMVDIDYFKKVNDKHGHQAGDLILFHVASIIKDCIREADSLYRYGGEEFFILLPHVDIKGAAVMADRFRRVVESYSFLLDKGKTRISITVSIGVTQMKKDEKSVGSFIDRADDALYRAKNLGRNKIVSI